MQAREHQKEINETGWKVLTKVKERKKHKSENKSDDEICMNDEKKK